MCRDLPGKSTEWKDLRIAYRPDGRRRIFMSFQKRWAATNNAPVTSQKPWLLLGLLVFLWSPPHLLFIWDLSTRSLAIEEEGRGKGELLFHLAGRPPSLIRRPFWRKCHLIRVACEHSATPSNSDMWDRWKEKHPWIRGRLSSTLFFTVCGRRGTAMVNSCVAGAWTHSRTLNAIWSHPCTWRWPF